MCRPMRSQATLPLWTRCPHRRQRTLRRSSGGSTLHSFDITLTPASRERDYLRLPGNAVVLSAIGGRGRDVSLSPPERRGDTNDGGVFLTLHKRSPQPRPTKPTKKERGHGAKGPNNARL